MANRKTLSKVQQKELKNKLVNIDKNGLTIKELAAEYKVSPATIHNYKETFKNEGADIPNIHGRRPGTVQKSGNASATVKAVTGHVPTGKTVLIDDGEEKRYVFDSDTFKFTFQGMPLEITGKRKKVNLVISNDTVSLYIQ